jgi:hypothetical protein
VDAPVNLNHAILQHVVGVFVVVHQPAYLPVKPNLVLFHEQAKAPFGMACCLHQGQDPLVCYVLMWIVQTFAGFD